MTTTASGRRARASVTSAVETITPKRAAEYLATMVENRPLRRGFVERYQRDIEAGRWFVNGEAVTFDWDGHLRNGQHRMHAIIKSGVAVETLVVRGVDPESFVSMDTGANRDFSDVLALSGESNTKNAAAATRLWLLYEQDNIGKKCVPTTGERRDMYERHKDAIVAGTPCVWKFSQARKLLGTANVAFIASYLHERFDPETAFLFLESIDKGDGLKEGDPVWALRRVLVNNAMSSRRMKPEVILALAIKAFTYWQKGRKVKVLVWREDEQFPRFPSR